MSRSPVWKRRWWVIGVGGSVGLAACGLNTDLPHRSQGVTPASSGVMLSGVAASDADAALGTGVDSLITDIKDGSGGGASAIAGGIDSGGAPDESAGGIGGAASTQGGAADAGGRAAQADVARGGVASATGGTASTAHAGASAAGGANTAPPTIYFSEYVEGSSSYKALEIAAQRRSVLDDCKVETYFNGKTEATVVATLSGVLEAREVLTLCSSSLRQKLGAAPCSQVGNLTFNGDDVIAISCSGTILDVIGQIGVDPGTAWGSAASSTLDHTLRRNCGITSGDIAGDDVFEPNGEWQAFPADTYDGLGTRGC